MYVISTKETASTFLLIFIVIILLLLPASTFHNSSFISRISSNIFFKQLHFFTFYQNLWKYKLKILYRPNSFHAMNFTFILIIKLPNNSRLHLKFTILTLLRKITKIYFFWTFQQNLDTSINEKKYFFYFLTFQYNMDFKGIQRYLQSNLPRLLLNNINLRYDNFFCLSIFPQF